MNSFYALYLMIICRPKLTKDISADDFKLNYWLKEELINFSRELGLSTSGGKIEISDRIQEYLETGRKLPGNKKIACKAISSFDWNNEKLTLQTLITDNYKNSENVRKFFIMHIGDNFRFNVEFMNWIKQNQGKNLADAIIKWREINALKRNPRHKTEILPQFEYNTYIRAFLRDNPKCTIKEAIYCWKKKRLLPVPKVYAREDLNFLQH